MGALAIPSSTLAWVAIAVGSVCAFLVGWWATPAELPARVKHGFRAQRRARSLGRSFFFRMVEPVLRWFAHHARRVRFPHYRSRLARQLVAAGEPAGLDVDEFIGLSVVVGLAGTIVGLLAVEDLGPVVVLVLTAAGFYYTHIWLGDTARKRLHLINKGLPYANDMLVLAMQAGIDFVGAVRQYVGKIKDPDDPMSQEFSRILQELELGRTRRAALEAFAERAPTEPVRGFCMAVIQAEQRGTAVADALKIQAGALRTHQSLLVEKVAGRAQVLVLLPLFCIFCSTLLVLFGGMVVRAMRGELL